MPQKKATCRKAFNVIDFGTCYFLFIVTLRLVSYCNAHGRLIEPPSRASAWRYGFQTPADYNDHELYCGGLTRQWKRNGGKCGECGDAWDLPEPRPHEHGGQWGQGIIVRRYLPGSEISIRIELTASHMGYFEFKICPKPSAKQMCLDQNVLHITRGFPSLHDEKDLKTRFYPRNGSRIYEITARLPDLLCNHCVLQWRYKAGNNWGLCEDGQGAVGCGPQEEFRACSDIAITIDARLHNLATRPIHHTTSPPTAPKNDQTELNIEHFFSLTVLISIIFLLLILPVLLICVVYIIFKPAMLSDWKEFLLNKCCQNSKNACVVNQSKVLKSIMSIGEIKTIGDAGRVTQLANIQTVPPIPPPRTKRDTRVRAVSICFSNLNQCR